MERATFLGSACCSDPATFVNEGRVVVGNSNNPAAEFALVRFVNRGTAQVNGAAKFDTLSPVQAGGQMTLARGARIVNEEPLRVAGGTLQGFGTITGDLTNLGTVSPGGPSSLGFIGVFGTYRQSPAGHLVLHVQGAESDRLGANRALELAGTLQLLKRGAGALGPSARVLVAGGDPRVGRFASILMRTLGSGWRVRYLPKVVRLELP